MKKRKFSLLKFFAPLLILLLVFSVCSTCAAAYEPSDISVNDWVTSTSSTTTVYIPILGAYAVNCHFYDSKQYTYSRQDNTDYFNTFLNKPLFTWSDPSAQAVKFSYVLLYDDEIDVDTEPLDRSLGSGDYTTFTLQAVDYYIIEGNSPTGNFDTICWEFELVGDDGTIMYSNRTLKFTDSDGDDTTCIGLLINTVQPESFVLPTFESNANLAQLVLSLPLASIPFMDNYYLGSGRGDLIDFESYNSGYSAGVSAGKLQADTVNSTLIIQAREQGFQEGYALGGDNNHPFRELILSVLNVPLEFFRSLFMNGSTILGVDIAGLAFSVFSLLTIITVCLAVVKVMRK